MAKPKKAAKKAVRKPVRKAAKKAVRKPVKKVVKKTVRKPVKKVVKKAVRKPVKKVVKKAVRKPVRKVVKKAVRRPPPKPVKKAARKVAPAAPARQPAKAAAPGFGAGRFCWHDLMVGDVDAALRFYTSLFGWTVQTMDMGPAGPYQMVAAGGVTFAGVMKLPMPGVPPHWMPYVAVADIDAACSTAQASGGAVVVPAMPIPDVGRFAVLADPTGGTMGAIQLSGPPMRDLDKPPALGMVGWNELVTPDTAKAGPFYTAVFGWKVVSSPMADGMPYEMFLRGESMEAGLMRTPPGAPADRGVWMTYFNVANVDAASSHAQTLGATVLMAPWDIAGVGRIAVLVDPQGAVFALFGAPKP